MDTGADFLVFIKLLNIVFVKKNAKKKRKKVKI